jgi:hypothetical protein
VTPLQPEQRRAVADVVGADVLAEDEAALQAAYDNYRRTVRLVQERPWRAGDPGEELDRRPRQGSR